MGERHRPSPEAGCYGHHLPLGETESEPQQSLTLRPGQSRRVTIPAREAWECRCARCPRVWISAGDDMPLRCPGCKTTHWQRLPTRKGWPKGVKRG